VFFCFAAAPFVGAAWQCHHSDVMVWSLRHSFPQLVFSFFLFFFHCAVDGVVVKALVFFCFAVVPFVATAQQGHCSDVMVWSLQHSLPLLVVLVPFFFLSLCSWQHWRRGIGVFLLCHGSFCWHSMAVSLQ